MSDSFPVGAWTWHDGKGGIFSTQILSDGHIRQQRQHAKDTEAAFQNLGVISPAAAAALLARCREALTTSPSPEQTAPDGKNGESYELVLAESETQKSSKQIARAALSSDGALQNIRREVLGARKKVARRWNIWRSAGARWFFLTTAVTLALIFVMGRDMKRDSELQARATHTTGTVIERGGTPLKSEFLKVKLPGAGVEPEVKISKYLSHPNWEAATPGSKVEVLYDADSGQAWLAADLLRWQHDKKLVWILPAFLLAAALIGLLWLRRYEIGVYGDGNEYMIREDRVVTDDKDMAVSRSTLLWFKMFV
jgi:hypothetical protein